MLLLDLPLSPGEPIAARGVIWGLQRGGKATRSRQVEQISALAGRSETQGP